MTDLGELCGQYDEGRAEAVRVLELPQLIAQRIAAGETHFGAFADHAVARSGRYNPALVARYQALGGLLADNVGQLILVRDTEVTQVTDSADLNEWSTDHNRQKVQTRVGVQAGPKPVLRSDSWGIPTDGPGHALAWTAYKEGHSSPQVDWLDDPRDQAFVPVWAVTIGKTQFQSREQNAHHERRGRLVEVLIGNDIVRRANLSELEQQAVERTLYERPLLSNVQLDFAEDSSGDSHT